MSGLEENVVVEHIFENESSESLQVAFMVYKSFDAICYRIIKNIIEKVISSLDTKSGNVHFVEHKWDGALLRRDRWFEGLMCGLAYDNQDGQFFSVRGVPEDSNRLALIALLNEKFPSGRSNNYQWYLRSDGIFNRWHSEWEGMERLFHCGDDVVRYYSDIMKTIIDIIDEWIATLKKE